MKLSDMASTHHSCRECCEITTRKPLIIQKFKVFSDFFTFTKNSDGYVEKHQKNGVDIEIAI
jgi:uncharacterized Rmd1/YagE family protein